MPRADATRIRAINDLLVEEMGDEDFWLNPFGQRKNDDEVYALDYLGRGNDGFQDGVILNPPTSFRQAEHYIKRFGLKWDGTTRWWADLKNEAARITKEGGKVVTISWDSTGLGVSRGFFLERVLMVNHGGHWHDTIVTVERKVGS